jgi:hypothetical protein
MQRFSPLRSLFVAGLLALGSWDGLSSPAWAQKGPEMGYVYPAGGRPGTTVEVQLGGYDWTPDMQYFVLDPRVQLKVLGPPGDFLDCPPPYWFGPKGRFPPYLIAREARAQFTIPADMPSGPIEWQVANANGVSATGTFWIGSASLPEVLEEDRRRAPQELPALPVAINGRLTQIEQVDRYRFSVPQGGLVTCELLAQKLGSKFHGVIEIHDAQGKLVCDAAATEGRDTCLTFAAQAGQPYLLSFHDVDFGGDWSLVYRLQLTLGPHVRGTIPAAGRRGETRPVEFVGIGVATGAAHLESVEKAVTFPSDPQLSTFSYRLETPFGTSQPITFELSDLPETVAAAQPPGGAPVPLTLPAALTGVFDSRAAEQRFVCTGKTGDIWVIRLESCRVDTRLDPTLTILGPDGKEVARNDDLPGTTDAAALVKLPADGDFTLVVNDISGKSGARDAIYRLVVEQPQPTGTARPDFALAAARQATVVIGGKVDLPLKVTRKAGFAEAIAVTVEGLPEGVTVPADLTVPAGKDELKIPLTAAADAPAVATLIKISGRAASLPVGPRVAEPLLLASIMKPRCKVEPVDKDGGRSVHRGTTFPAEVIVTRLEGFEGEVKLEMTARQSYQRQGITGLDLIVPPGVTRTYYRTFMPEWLELDRTSRMVVNAVVKVPDPRGNVRHLVSLMDGRITMSMEGALLKLSHTAGEIVAKPGASLEIPLKIGRSPKLPEAVRLELVPPPELAGLLIAEPITLPAEQSDLVYRVQTVADPRMKGEWTFTLKAVALQGGELPVVSQTDVHVDFESAP